MNKKIVMIVCGSLIVACISCANKSGGLLKQQGERKECSVSEDIDSMSPYWYDKDQTEVFLSEKKDTLYRFPRIKMGGVYSIPFTVKYIEERAFMGCKELEEVYVPRSVNHIEMAAFEGCPKLEYVYLYASIDTIPFRCFNHCDNLKELHIGNPRPLYIEEFGIDGINKDSCTLYVPKGTKERYKKDEGWKNFKTIEEEDSYMTVFKKPLDNVNYHEFFITKGENGYLFMAYDSSKDIFNDIHYCPRKSVNNSLKRLSALRF